MTYRFRASRMTLVSVSPRDLATASASAHSSSGMRKDRVRSARSYPSALGTGENLAGILNHDATRGKVGAHVTGHARGVDDINPVRALTLGTHECVVPVDNVAACVCGNDHPGKSFGHGVHFRSSNPFRYTPRYTSGVYRATHLNNILRRLA